MVRLCLAYGVTPVFIPFAEPWRNGVVEHFNDTWDKSFFRAERFGDLDQLRARLRKFEAFHNAHHRYSALKGATPDEADARAALSPCFTQLSWCDTDPAGSVEYIRFIRSDGALRILDFAFELPEWVVYEYVTATTAGRDRETGGPSPRPTRRHARHAAQTVNDALSVTPPTPGGTMRCRP